jgi:hypothetical protein
MRTVPFAFPTPLSTLPHCKRVPYPYSKVLPLSSCPTGQVYTSRLGLTAEFPHTQNHLFIPVVEPHPSPPDGLHCAECSWHVRLRQYILEIQKYTKPIDARR